MFSGGRPTLLLKLLSMNSKLLSVELSYCLSGAVNGARCSPSYHFLAKVRFVFTIPFECRMCVVSLSIMRDSIFTTVHLALLKLKPEEQNEAWRAKFCSFWGKGEGGSVKLILFVCRASAKTCVMASSLHIWYWQIQCWKVYSVSINMCRHPLSVI